LKAFQKDLERFEKLNAQVLGVSDDDLKTLESFMNEHGITFPLIADDERKARKAYGWGRQTYLIDKKGRVRFIQKGVPDNELFLKELEKLEKE